MAGVDYTETFSPVVKHSTIRLVLSLVVSKKWLVRQLDVQNAFLHGYLTEQVYMRQPSGFTDKQFPNHVCKLQSFLYDDILITGNSPSQMEHLIKKLGSLFSMKDLGNLSYFLGIELSAFVGDPYADPALYRSVVGALQYLTITRPDLSYVVNQATYDHGLLYKPDTARLTTFSDADYAGNSDTRHSTSGFCVYLGSNLVSWSSKKQKTVSRSSAEAEYRQLAYTAAELSWLKSLYKDLHMHLVQPTIWYDNISSIALASNPVFHSRTKHLEVDYHYVRGQLQDQLADIFTKGLSSSHFKFLVSKLPVVSPPVSLRGAGFQILRCNREVLINTSIPQLNGHKRMNVKALLESHRSKPVIRLRLHDEYSLTKLADITIYDKCILQHVDEGFEAVD
ncbi:unnamed protein product [Malus baccata var. baccata]